MNKEDLMFELKTMLSTEFVDAVMFPKSMTINGLRQVIALVEIRESIDDLRSSMEELSKDIHLPFGIRHLDDQGKDVRSAGIG